MIGGQAPLPGERRFSEAGLFADRFGKKPPAARLGAAHSAAGGFCGAQWRFTAVWTAARPPGALIAGSLNNGMEGPGLDQKQIDACRGAFKKHPPRCTQKNDMGAQSGAFIGTSFSCADILGVLYGGFYHQDDDLMIMSKGHGASAWYAALAEASAFDRERLFKEFNVSGFHMGVHPKRNNLPGIRTSTSSLGHGLGLAAGAALAKRRITAPAAHM